MIEQKQINKKRENQEIKYSKGEGNFRVDVTIHARVQLPCPRNGQGFESSDMFKWGRAFLCYFEVRPFGVLIVSGFRVSDDPEKEQKKWYFDPPVRIDDEWDETTLFYENAEKAVSGRIKDLQDILQKSSLNITCRSCEQREQCMQKIQSLASNQTANQTPSFFSY